MNKQRKRNGLSEQNRSIVVIGGGAAGMLAALTAARLGAEVTLLERNQKVGRKLYITGKGRCNLTNNCTVAEFLDNVPRNGRFLTSAVTRFPPAAVQTFFTDLGVPLKTERGNRVFPRSDRAADVVDALFFALRRSRVSLVQDRAAHILTQAGVVTGVQGERGRYAAGQVILATGGVSYPLTGSTGDGYAMAAGLGHTILPPRPSLVPLEADGEDCPRMQGLSLRNVVLKVKNRKGKKLQVRFKKVADAAGYEIAYSRGVNFGKKKTKVKSFNAAKNVRTLKKLKKGKRYFRSSKSLSFL